MVSPVTFNPLFLYGGVGLGKTHLMHAIAWRINELYPDCKVLYLSAEQFMYRFIQAIRHRSRTSERSRVPVLRPSSMEVRACR